MPRRDDLESILLIGSGPIVIGQACEFDYSGTQACRVLRDEGYRVILANSNPATIMTDPEFADATYVEPLDADILTQIIERERPDAVLPTLGGQTALNLAMQLVERGVVASGTGHARADRRQRRGDRDRRGPRAVQGRHAGDRPRACRRPASPTRSTKRSEVVDRIGLPVIIRPAFILGGKGTGIASTPDEFERVAAQRPRRQPDQRDPHRAVDRRVEGVRARGHARPRGQLRRHLLDREPRPDGRAHRRLDHGRAGADAERRRVPGDARRRVRVHPPRRRRDRRIERAVRARPDQRRHGHHRDEPARVARRARSRRRPPASRSPRSRPGSRSATRSTRSRTTSRRRRRRASSRSSTTSSPRCRAGRSRSSPAPAACSARRCSRSARRWRSAARSPSRCRRRCGRSSTAASASTAIRPRRSSTSSTDDELVAPRRDRHARPSRSISRPRCGAASRIERLYEATKVDPWFLDQIAQIVDERAHLADDGLRRR